MLTSCMVLRKKRFAVDDTAHPLGCVFCCGYKRACWILDQLHPDEFLFEVYGGDLQDDFIGIKNRTIVR